MGEWLHFLYDREEGVQWRHFVPLLALLCIGGLAWGVVVGLGGLSAPTIWRLLFGRQVTPEVQELQKQQPSPVAPPSKPTAKFDSGGGNRGFDTAAPPQAPLTAPKIPPGPVLKIGNRDYRVPIVRRRLGILDDDAAGDTYDKVLGLAVKDFQQRVGIRPTGTLTQETIDALNGDVGAPIAEDKRRRDDSAARTFKDKTPGANSTPAPTQGMSPEEVEEMDRLVRKYLASRTPAKTPSLEAGSDSRCVALFVTCKNDILQHSAKAQSSCREVTECDPNNGEAWAQLGYAARNAGDLDAAERAFDRELQIASSQKDSWLIAWSYRNLGQLHKERGSLEDAEQEFRLALSVTFDDPFLLADIYDNLGDVYLQKGNIDTAESYLKKALSIPQPKRSPSLLGATYFGLGLVAIKRGDRSVGCSNLRTAYNMFAEANVERRMSQLSETMHNAGCPTSETSIPGGQSDSDYHLSSPPPFHPNLVGPSWLEEKH